MMPSPDHPRTETPLLLHAEGLQFGWPGQPPLLTGRDLHLPAGVSFVTGDESCGKTSLLRLLAADLVPQAGRIALWAEGAWCSPDGDPAAWRRQVFWIDPATEAHDALSPRQFWDRQAQVWPRFSADAVAALSEDFALAPHLDKPLYMLSAGSRRKVWLTAGFASGATLTLIDQPFAALDGPSMRCLRGLFTDANDHPGRAWVVADYEVPEGVPLAAHIRLP